MKATSKTIKTEILALCNYAEFTMNGKFNIIGIYDQLRVDKALRVWAHGFVVFTIKSNLKNVQKKLRLQIINKTGASLLDIALVVNIGANGKANFLFEFANLKVKDFGNYSIRLTDPDEDDAYIGDTEITVFPGEINEKGSGKEKRIN